MDAREIYQELAASGLSLQQSLEFTDRVLGMRKEGSLAALLSAIPGGLEKFTGALRNVQQTTYPLALAAAAIPPVVGYTAGDALARSLDSDKGDVDDIMQSELIAELNTAANQLRRSRELGNKI